METKWKLIIMTAFIVALILVLSTLVYPVSAQTSPRPVSVQVISSAENLQVELRDMTINKAAILSTNEFNEIIADANVIFDGYRDNDTIRATFLVCSATCVQEKILGNAVYFEFDLSSLNPTTTIETTSTIPVVTTTSISETTTTLPVECDSCCLDCPSGYTDVILVGVLTLIFASSGGVILIKKYFITLIKKGWGVRIYKSLDGSEIIVTHKHPGIKNYHNPDTVHVNPSVRHSKGKVF